MGEFLQGQRKTVGNVHAKGVEAHFVETVDIVPGEQTELRRQ
jgi:hypothetical protein